MNFKHCVFTLVIVMAVTGCASEKNSAQTKLRGLWKLDKYESLDTTTGIWQNTQSRLNYTGYIVYDGWGHMSTQIQPQGFYHAETMNNPDSLDADKTTRLLKLELSSFCYFANYKLSGNGKTIEHVKLSSNIPKEINTTVKRMLAFSGDTLILTAFEPIAGLKTRLRWVKQ